MNELAIYEDESQMRIAIETIDLYQQQIKNMESEVERIKKVILTAMQENGLKIVEVAGAKFNRITPSKKVLDKAKAECFLVEHNLLNMHMKLDEKKVMASFPQFVEDEEGTEYLKISEVK